MSTGFCIFWGRTKTKVSAILWERLIERSEILKYRVTVLHWHHEASSEGGADSKIDIRQMGTNNTQRYAISMHLPVSFGIARQSVGETILSLREQRLLPSETSLLFPPGWQCRLLSLSFIQISWAALVPMIFHHQQHLHHLKKAQGCLQQLLQSQMSI